MHNRFRGIEQNEFVYDFCFLNESSDYKERRNINDVKFDTFRD